MADATRHLYIAFDIWFVDDSQFAKFGEWFLGHCKVLLDWCDVVFGLGGWLGWLCGR